MEESNLKKVRDEVDGMIEEEVRSCCARLSSRAHKESRGKKLRRLVTLLTSGLTEDVSLNAACGGRPVYDGWAKTWDKAGKRDDPNPYKIVLELAKNRNSMILTNKGVEQAIENPDDKVHLTKMLTFVNKAQETQKQEEEDVDEFNF